MSTDETHEELLREVLDNVVKSNLEVKPGTPMAELQEAIETAISNLPPLEFEEFNQAISDTDAAARLVRNAPEMIGWNADKIVEWVEELSGKISTSDATE